jgi:hypothetical protein
LRVVAGPHRASADHEYTLHVSTVVGFVSEAGIDGRRRWTREIALGSLLTAVVASLLLLAGPAPGDAPAHLYRTLLVQHGVFVWDNLWYAGQYPLASYSVLYYLPAAVVGNLPLVFAAALVSTALFSSITLREWGVAALWPSRVFGVLAAAPLFTGLYSYSLGFATMLGAVRALQARKTWLAIVLAGLTVGFSPLAFAFLCLIVAAVWASRRGISKRIVAVGAGLTAIAGLEVLTLALFATPGSYPFHTVNFIGVLLVSGLGIMLAGRAHGGTPIAGFFALWAAGSVVIFLVHSPLGDNWTRLDAFVFPVMLLTASLAGFRPRRLVTLALAVALAYNVVPYLLLIPYRLDGRPAHASFWQPAVDFLRSHSGPDFRVEVVPTAAHWESYWLPASGLALARGWYRQLDLANNPTLYRTGLNAPAYRQWLRANGVKYVLLPATTLDEDAAPREARVIRSPASGLVLVDRDATGSIYELPHATPLLTGPGRAQVTRVGHITINGVVSAPGLYLLRVHYNPYWKLHGTGCVQRGPARMTVLDLTAPGQFSITVPGTADGLFDAATMNHDAGC